jgi:hypothetical protein
LRERLAFGILIGVLIFLFAIVFAVLGRGEYQPPGSEGLIYLPQLVLAAGESLPGPPF